MPKKTFPRIGRAAPKAIGVSILLAVRLAVSAEISVTASYDEAIAAYRAGNYEQALNCLDKLEALDLKPPTHAEVQNLRALILMRECDYEAAESVLEGALELDPSLSNAKFNLAEIPFMNRDWVEARKRFERILVEESGDLGTDVRELVRFKIFLTFLLERNDAAAEEAMKNWEQTRPAVYYARAAIARNHGREEEARKWQIEAISKFGEATNKLYAESFYEVGWEQRPMTQRREDFAISSASERTQLEAGKALDKAASDVSSGHFENALTSLAHAEEQLPQQGLSHNMRAEILIKQGKLDQAESELRTALEIDPKLSGAAYNLAAIYFKRQQFSQARDQLEKLFAAATEPQSQQFLKYKVFLSFLLEGSEYQAELMMKRFTYTAETPAVYYAHAAWSFQHGEADRGKDWVQTAERLYSPALNLIFADDFYQLHWLSRSSDEPGSSKAASTIATLPDPPASLSMPMNSSNWTFEAGLAAPPPQFASQVKPDFFDPLPPAPLKP